MAAFANNRGGYLVFGVSNQPRRLVGLSSKNFETLDEAVITAYLNGLFSPEIYYEKFVTDICGKQVGIIYAHKSIEAIIGIKNDGDVKEGEIYYRYNVGLPRKSGHRNCVVH
jgi:predicted HTH transcriptional regulator